MSKEKPDLNVYGHNLPDERGKAQPGIREKGTAEDLDETRERNAVKTGGMGREETPKEAKSEGKWHHDDQQAKQKAHEDAADPDPDWKDTPMPPRNAPLSDEVPS